jgi:hypothetical protein
MNFTIRNYKKYMDRWFWDYLTFAERRDLDFKLPFTDAAECSSYFSLCVDMFDTVYKRAGTEFLTMDGISLWELK